jgi:uncharacterized protein (TIGR02145 family)
MRKLFLFPVLAAFAILGCSNNDDMPCVTCGGQPQNTYAYCLYYNSGYGDYRCSYMSVYECNGVLYNDDYDCEYELRYYYSSSSSSFRSSSSSYPSSSSSSSVSVQSGIIPGTPVTYGNETYQTVVIGSQTWMARNLNYDPGTGNSRCYDCAKYGRLYDWATAMGLQSSCNSNSCSSQISAKHRGICPPNWHIPSDSEWDILMNAVGGSSTAGRYLKATSGWYSGGNGIDKYGFSALPGGFGYSDGNFSSAGSNGNWWSSTENGAYNAYFRDMYYDGESVFRYDSNKSYYLFSVRCLQD